MMVERCLANDDQKMSCQRKFAREHDVRKSAMRARCQSTMFERYLDKSSIVEQYLGKSSIVESYPANSNIMESYLAIAFIVKSYLANSNIVESYLGKSSIVEGRSARKYWKALQPPLQQI